MVEKEFDNIIKALEILEEDNTTPRNIKNIVAEIKKMLNETSEKSIKVNRIMHELEKVADDINMQSYTRTQIWNIVSMLEKI